MDEQPTNNSEVVLDVINTQKNTNIREFGFYNQQSLFSAGAYKLLWGNGLLKQYIGGLATFKRD